MSEAEENKFNAASLNLNPTTFIKTNKITDKQKETLAKFDNAKFGWKHVKTCLIAGIGFFTVKQHNDL